MNSKYARYNAMADEALASIREDRDKKYASRVVQHDQDDQETWDAYQTQLAHWRPVWLDMERPQAFPNNEVTLEYVCTHPKPFMLALENPTNGYGPLLLVKLAYKVHDVNYPTPCWYEAWGAYNVGYWNLAEVFDAKRYYLRWLVELEQPPNRW